MPIHASLDWETLDTKPTAIVLTLGAVKFDPEKGRIWNKFYRRISLKSVQGRGLTMSPETLLWWMTDPKVTAEARQEAFGGTDDLKQSMIDFRSWYNRSDEPCSAIWGHGSIFDVSICDNVFRALALESPYKFHDVRDTRTILAAANVPVERDKSRHHIAVDDAVDQAVAVCKAYRKLGLGTFTDVVIEGGAAVPNDVVAAPTAGAIGNETRF